MFAARSQCFNSGIRGQHAGLHRRMRALDSRHVQETGRTPDQCAARESQLWYRLPATIADRTRAIRDATPPSEYLLYLWMRFPTLKFFER